MICREYHKKAHHNIVEKFGNWKKAKGISWKEYLKELMENAYTGTWAKEVAMHILKNMDE